jgi:hypothetical protein
MRIRIEVHRHDDPTRDLEIAGSLRRDLWAHSPVEFDPDDPAVATKRDAETGRAYFEFDTEFPDEVDRVIDRFAYTNHVTVVPLSAHPSA